MKKTVLIPLFAALLCSCNGALDPTEEPIIRGKGIEDRIYLASEGHTDKNLQCTITIQNKQLTLALSEKVTFTVSLYNNDSGEVVFAQMYFNSDKCAFDLSGLPNSVYTLYINDEGVYSFTIKDAEGSAYSKTDISAISWDEILRAANSVPRDVIPVSILNNLQSRTLIAFSFCNIGISEKPVFLPECDGTEVEIADIGQAKGIIHFNKVPQTGWADKADIQPLHGYFLRKRMLLSDGVTYSDYQYARLFVLEFSVGHEGLMRGTLQFQTLGK